MKKLIVDTETSGLPSNWKAYDEDTTIWPRVVEIAWIVLDYEDKTIISKNVFIHIFASLSQIYKLNHEKTI